MRYYITVRIGTTLCVVGEVVADVNPAENDNWIRPAGLADELATYFDDVDNFRCATAEELDHDCDGARALRAWRNDDDTSWERERLAFNLAQAGEAARFDLKMLARHGHTDAGLLLREGSFAQQREYIERHG